MKLLLSLFITAISGCFFACNSSSKVTTLPTDITGVRWKLVELNGQPVNVLPADGKEPFILFETATNKVTGNGGCNSIGGTYMLQQNNSIKLSQLFSTKMACNSLETETQFMRVLESTDRYAIVNDTLTFHKGALEQIAKYVATVKQ